MSAAETRREESGTLVAKRPKPSGPVPKGCTWNGLQWIDSMGQPRADNQTRLDKAATPPVSPLETGPESDFSDVVDFKDEDINKFICDDAVPDA